MPETTAPELPRLAIPNGWTASIKAAMLHVISLAQYAMAYTRSWAANSPNERIRLKGKVDERDQQNAALREIDRIKGARMARIPPAQRPRYEPAERLAILELRAAQCWSIAETARVFQVTEPTISSWMKRLDEDGPDVPARRD